MPKVTKDTPTNSTFASRAAARDGAVTPRRRVSLRAGDEAETDFEIRYVNEGGGVRNV